MAEEEEEDLFAGTETADPAQAPSQPAPTEQKLDGKLDSPRQPAELEDGEEEGEAIEEDSSDSVGFAMPGEHSTEQVIDTAQDVDIITEKPPAPAQATDQASTTAPGKHGRTDDGDQEGPAAKASKMDNLFQDSSGRFQRKPDPSSTPQKPGSEYPEQHYSEIDVNANPIFPDMGKPVIDIDFDEDPYMREHSKPWRLPGTDPSDYFNYGFDEFTWASYCLKQKTMRSDIKQQQQQQHELKKMFGGVGDEVQQGEGSADGVGANHVDHQNHPQPPQQPNAMEAMMGGGMAGMPGMPDMGVMMQQMMAAGLNPQNEADFQKFMMQQMGMGGPGGGGGAPQGPQYGGGGMMDPSMGGGMGAGPIGPRHAGGRRRRW